MFLTTTYLRGYDFDERFIKIIETISWMIDRFPGQLHKNLLFNNNSSSLCYELTASWNASKPLVNHKLAINVYLWAGKYIYAIDVIEVEVIFTIDVIVTIIMYTLIEQDNETIQVLAGKWIVSLSWNHSISTLHLTW